MRQGSYRAAAEAAETPIQAEARVFRRVAKSLELAAGLSGSSPRRIRAIADARRLWVHCATLTADRDNRLPRQLRADIVSVSLAVLRELDAAEPDLAFVAEVTSAIADGLEAAARNAGGPAAAPDAMAVLA